MNTEPSRSSNRPGPASDPFGETADPGQYVPRPATTRVLDSLVRRVEAEGRPAALTGPPGIGKTLLLHRVAERVRDWLPSVYLPYAALDSQDLSAWILGLAGEAPAKRPQTAVLGLCGRLQREQSALVVLIDEAGSMPLETARALGKQLEESAGGLRVVLAATDDAAASRVIAALAPNVDHLRLTAPMNASELRHYVRSRLERAGAPPDVRVRFDDDALAWIHRLSGGVPRRVHEIAARLCHDSAESITEAWWEDQWLGAPIDALSASAVEAALTDDQDLGPELPDVLLEAEVDRVAPPPVDIRPRDR